MIKEASGASICKNDLLREDRVIMASEAGVAPGNPPVQNTAAINAAIENLAGQGGGTLIFAPGTYRSYTIRLRSNVNLKLLPGAVIQAAKAPIHTPFADEPGEGGNYDEPEVNLYAGLQDQGHTTFANSLVYAADQKNIMIYGGGRFDGSALDPETGLRSYTLQGGDPQDGTDRTKRAYTGEWFGNKCLALVRCEHVVLSDIEILIGGHFGIIGMGTVNFLVEDTVVDTNRDAFNIDCCQNVTVQRSWFNSLTDDGIVLKASFGPGKYMPCQNVLVRDCTVSGYDAGSVIARTYTVDKLTAADRCGPTGRCKLGTEASCGYNTVTFENITFRRTRGFALETTDCSEMHDIIFRHVTMDTVSSSPFFIRVGDRGRFPVTGNSEENRVRVGDGNVRLDDRGWVLPNNPEIYDIYPPMRYAPSYLRDREVSVDGMNRFNIVRKEDGVRVNMGNIAQENGRYYLKKYDVTTHQFVTDLEHEIAPNDLGRYANAFGGPLARAYNIEISDVTVKNADPRYPVLLAGLVDSKIENVSIRDVDITYRGGLSMQDAVEQRQINTNWSYTQYETAPASQSIPWMVNTFFAKNETLLPRVSYHDGKWQDDPYNVPEAVADYPEPSILGILPAYGLYARHILGLKLENVNMRYQVEDTRPAIVLDDAAHVQLLKVEAQTAADVPMLVGVQNRYKRHTGFEYYPDEPYFITGVSDVTLPEGASMKGVVVSAPAPGTPADKFYDAPTVPIPENGYAFSQPTQHYPLPKTVHRPFIRPLGTLKVHPGQTLRTVLEVRDPACEFADVPTGMHALFCPPACWQEEDSRPLSGTLKAVSLPEGATLEGCELAFNVPADAQGTYTAVVAFDDSVLCSAMEIVFEVIQD